MIKQLDIYHKPVIAWWSGGVTSAVTCKICLDLYDSVRIVFIDTKNEDDDTYRFLLDCEKWYGKTIETISKIGDKYQSIKDVWYRYNSLNVANGAICSSELKRDVRRVFTTHNPHLHQAFGFDVDEAKRVKSMKLNNAEASPIFPLLMYGYSKKDCIKILTDAGIEIPDSYHLGFNNNNCLKTGCIQGGVGYWQMMKEVKPDNFYNMAKIEHELTNRKGKPVTMHLNPC
jgi:hypothetical protein